jgi:Mn-dependent DtxR family transcriptional regulator
MSLQESGEMYFESIYMLTKSKGSVRSIDIVEYMNYSKASVSRAVKLLKNGEFILIDEHGYITLTQSGREVAEKIVERHTLISSFLVSLGVNKTTASEDACKIEHVISDESFNAIKQYAEKVANSKK